MVPRYGYSATNAATTNAKPIRVVRLKVTAALYRFCGTGRVPQVKAVFTEVPRSMEFSEVRIAPVLCTLILPTCDAFAAIQCRASS
jgi:hypothetical protein